MENKFYVKDVEWIRDETFFIKVNHIPSRVSIKVDGINFNVSSGEWTQSVLSALHQLQEKVNKHYEEKENEMKEKQSENYEVNLTKSMIDNQTDIRKDEDYLNGLDRIQIRTKALELAMNFLEINKAAYSLGDPQVISTEVHIATAKRFYKYIVKGE